MGKKFKFGLIEKRWKEKGERRKRKSKRQRAKGKREKLNWCIVYDL